jgi:hypothetical protein
VKYHPRLIIPALLLALFQVSCSDNDCPHNTQSYTVPATYTFMRNEATTVDYTGQTQRMLMLEEMGAYIRTQATSGEFVDQSKLAAMYTNSASPFTQAALNTGGRQLRDKTAASKDYFSLFFGGGTATEQAAVRTFFESSFADAQSAGAGSAASAGVAGSYLDGSSVRLFAANGLEPREILLKGMMGAVMMDQIVNNYLSVQKLDEGTLREDNTNKVIEAGKNYTTMEHFWDEAYGYVYGADVTSTNPVTRKFWSSYIMQVNADVDFNTIDAEIDLAFRKGRAAIVANDYATRDQQIAIIKQKMALVTAVRAVFYLQEGKAKLGIDAGAKAFHALSEAYGFIMTLRYTNKPGTNNPYFSKSEVDAMLAQLVAGNNGLWDSNPVVLDQLSAQIAARFGFTVAQASTVN